MNRELKNKYLDMLMDEYESYLAVDDFKSIFENITQDTKLRRHRQEMFTVLYETIPECIDNIDPDLLWKFTEENKYLEEFKIPMHITRVKKDAFYYCLYLKSIEIPSIVTSIGEEAFFACPNLIIYTKNQYVINYCKENNIEYEEI